MAGAPLDEPINSAVKIENDEWSDFDPSHWGRDEPKCSLTAKDLLESGRVGLWKDRSDIGDTLEFVVALRGRRRQARSEKHAMTTTKTPMEEQAEIANEMNGAEDDLDDLVNFRWGSNDEKPKTGRELYEALQKSGMIGAWKERPDIGDRVEQARAARRLPDTGEE